MAERLTELDCYDDYQILEEDLPKAIDKLGKLEDILEKYGIESVEDLDKLLTLYKSIVDSVDKLKQCGVDMTSYMIVDPDMCFADGISMSSYIKLKQDRDKWRNLYKKQVRKR